MLRVGGDVFLVWEAFGTEPSGGVIRASHRMSHECKALSVVLGRSNAVGATVYAVRSSGAIRITNKAVVKCSGLTECQRRIAVPWERHGEPASGREGCTAVGGVRESTVCR